MANNVKDFDKPETDEKPVRKVSARIQSLADGLIYDPAKYEFKEDWVPANKDNPMEVHSTSELVEYLERHKKNRHIEVEARIIGVGNNGKTIAKLDRKQFMEMAKRKDSKKMREALDSFNYDDGSVFPQMGNKVGDDFTPLLGGPFNKQLYYRDYLRMISACFYAFHHDPVARDVVSIISDFTLGRGFDLNTDNPQAQILWDAFCDANDLELQMDYCSEELAIYGEVMWWWLPGNEARISFQPAQNEKVPKALIPRIRLFDPSNIAEIVTVPEDMWKGVLYYVWLAPTQYQMWTDGNQPSTKFIYNQIPADQIMHFKVNTVSNEKRGRSDYFPALGYMKRLRDSVNYSIIAEQKAAAWCIDTTIEGNDQDISDYIASQQALGQFAAAGSEFIHTKAVQREYLSNSATGKGKESPVFNWCLNMIAMASGIPVSYFGTHLSGGQTRASALVSTEPVAKKFERRQGVYQRMLKAMFNQLMQRFGIEADCEITFPELITQDRSAKLKDLALAMNSDWISHKRAADIAAQELDITDFDYRTEMQDIEAEDAELGINPGQTSPLTAPAQKGQTDEKVHSATPGSEKKKIKDNSRDIHQ